MNDKLIIKTKSLKGFLELFDRTERLENLSLGDTWHPSSGYVDEEVLGGKRVVSDIMQFDYDFRGLVAFTCKIGSMTINLVDGERGSEIGQYEVQGSEQDIRVLHDKVIEENTCSQGKYEINTVPLWNNKS